MKELMQAAEMVLEAWDWDWSEPRNQALRKGIKALRRAIDNAASDKIIAENERPGLYDDQPKEWKNCRHCGFQYGPPKDDKWHPLVQPEQEPIAWINNDQEVFFDEGKARCYSMGWIKPLYTAPPKREWVGLTDDKIYQILGNVREQVDGNVFLAFAKDIEAKLKEKNT